MHDRLFLWIGYVTAGLIVVPVMLALIALAWWWAFERVLYSMRLTRTVAELYVYRTEFRAWLREHK